MRAARATSWAVLVLLASWATAGFAQDDTAKDEPAAPAAEEVQVEPLPAEPEVVQLGEGTREAAMKAYQEALHKQRLGSGTRTLSAARLREELARCEQMLLDGRRDEAIGDLVYWTSNPGFAALSDLPEGRGLRFMLGDALAQAGVVEMARGYLRPLLQSSKRDSWFRRAVRTLIDLGLHTSHGATLLADLEPVAGSAPPELQADIAYLRGRVAESGGDRKAALAAYKSVTARGRFWAQAQYRAGLLHVEARQLKKGEALFCKVADPKLTPKQAPLFGGSDFFRVRDLARLGLGRIAHEQYRFDDARYYYYLVPQDSEHVSEALYESATSRYEAKDYEAARELLEELRARGESHPYEDEAWILEAYVDMALCDFPQGDAKLRRFIKRYEPVRSAIRRLLAEPAALQSLVEALRLNQDPATVGLGVGDDTARTLGVLLRVDASYSQGAQQMAELEHQLKGLSQVLGELDDVRSRLADGDQFKPRPSEELAAGADDKAQLVREQLSDLQRLLRELDRSGKKQQALQLRREVNELEARARQAEQQLGVARVAPASDGKPGLSALVAEDRESASALFVSAQQLRGQLSQRQQTLAKESFERLDRRLSRLLSRARLGRVETVLGKKRSLEIEIEALAQGLLPRDAVDSLDAARYLKDSEEYWPFDGEDWADEYVGGEGLR